jgi:bifunctional DNase/RNase
MVDCSFHLDPRSILNGTGTNLDYIVINDLQNDVFYASLMLNANWTQMEIDARPSDAIAIALRVRAPIYVTRAVLEKAGVPPELETVEYATMHVEKGKPGLASKCSML